MSDGVVEQMKFIRGLMGQMGTRLDRVVGNAVMDFSKTKLMADRVRDWTKSGSLEMYSIAKQKGLGIEEYLEEEDPSPRDMDGNLLVPLDAFERLGVELDFGLHTKVDHFFAGPGMTLMPALITRWVREGIEMGRGGQDLWSFIDEVEGLHAHPIAWEKEGAAAEAAQMPKTTVAKKQLSAAGKSGLAVTHIGYRDADIALGTFGRVIDVDYAVVRNARMVKLRRIFQRIGVQIAFDEVGNVFSIILNGDGVTGVPPARLVISGSGGAGVLTFADLTTAIAQMAPFRITHWVTDTNGIADFLNLSQFTGPNFRDQTLGSIMSGGEGPIVTSLGVLLAGSGATADNIIFLDARFAMVKAVGQPLTVEADKIISQRWERVAISEELAYYKDESDASGRINYSA